MDEDLRIMWETIDDPFFDGQLKSLAAIDWAETSGPEGDGAHGRYCLEEERIVIDDMFRFSRDSICMGDKAAEVNTEVAYILWIHGMFHQFLHQNMAPNPGGHGRSFARGRATYHNYAYRKNVSHAP